MKKAGGSQEGLKLDWTHHLLFGADNVALLGGTLKHYIKKF
jgi:hypothetical protein